MLKPDRFPGKSTASLQDSPYAVWRGNLGVGKNCGSLWLEKGEPAELCLVKDVV